MNFDIKSTEIEYKYDANEIELNKFHSLAKSLNPLDYTEVSSWDIYYAPPDKSQFSFDFMRLRLGSKPELTIKIKKDESNNQNRIEVDIPLDPNKSSKELIYIANTYCQQFGFVERFRIFKYCCIYVYEKTDLVYYITYNEEMKEKGRFLEIECRKDGFFKDEDEAWFVLKFLEQKISSLGISPQSRRRKSQWELNK